MPKKANNIKNLIPAKKGEVRNPKGRGKGTLNSKTRLRPILEYIQSKTNPLTLQKEDLSILDQMDIAIIKRALDGDVRAYQEILDRLEGKPDQKQQIELKEEEKTIIIWGGKEVTI
jgi:hypothetical protein